MTSNHQFTALYKWRSPTRSSFIRLLVLVFLSNAIFPSLVGATLSSSADANVGKVLLCTSNGYQWVDIGSEDSFDDSTPHCIFCLAAQDETDFIDGQSAFVFPLWILDFTENSILDYFASQSPYALARLRAPPVNSL